MSLFDDYVSAYPSNSTHTVPRSLHMPSSQLHHFSVLAPAQPQQAQAPAPASQQSSDPKKRHACPTCSRAFTTSGHLARHIRVHTGERNHKCPFPGCETRCSRQDNLQQHYRIHLSPGSRRTSSSRARTEAKKKSSLSTSTSPSDSASPPAMPTHDVSHASALPSLSQRPGHRTGDEPPDSPPPLARATVLPTMPSHRSLLSRSDHSDRSSTSASGSSAGSPRSSYHSASGSPELGRPVGQGVGGTSASPFMNVLGLSHERTHSPQTTYGYPSGLTSPSSSQGQSQGIYHHRSLSADAYHASFPTPSVSPPLASLSHPHPSHSASLPTGPTLPPIQSLQPSFPGGSSMSGLGLGRVPQQQHHQQQQQHPGPYPSYDAGSVHSLPQSTNGWATHHDSPYGNSSATQSQNWWNTVPVGVGVGGGRGYAQQYGS